MRRQGNLLTSMNTVLDMIRGANKTVNASFAMHEACRSVSATDKTNSCYTSTFQETKRLSRRRIVFQSTEALFVHAYEGKLKYSLVIPPLPSADTAIVHYWMTWTPCYYDAKCRSSLDLSDSRTFLARTQIRDHAIEVARTISHCLSAPVQGEYFWNCEFPLLSPWQRPAHAFP